MAIGKIKCPKCKDVFHNTADRVSIMREDQCTNCLKGIITIDEEKKLLAKSI